MTYYIETEKERKEGCNQILIRSIIKTRRKNIRTELKHVDDNELKHVDDNPDVETFLLDAKKDRSNDMIGNVETVENEETWDSYNKVPEDNAIDLLPTGTLPDDILPPEEQSHLTPEEAEALYDQFQMEDDEDSTFEQIVGHSVTSSGPTLKVKYCGMSEEEFLDVPFRILQRDVPLELAKYVRDNVIEEHRGGHYNTWTKHITKSHHGQTIHRLCRHNNIGRTIQTISYNQQSFVISDKEKYGIKISDKPFYLT
jgi:hypothetical protein